MIVRSWHGIVPLEKAEEFRKYLLNTGIKEAKAIDGNQGAYIYGKSQGQYEHFFMVSYWEDVESIKKFAGKNPKIAVTYPEDDVYCLISDPIVLHHEVERIPLETELFLF
ncbi:MAG: hypothetical protein CVV02_17645 [Firmicutes bacterium HGW-Firmicutes-7]|nr:MAG: hypothetical protein CVV02_17645 [Firmicutes bacterium HGW-Firmicutes-7]